MKTFVSILAIMLLFTSSHAQTPLAFSSAYKDLVFESYTQGHDEFFFTPQAMELKGKVKSCIVEEIPESRAKKTSGEPLATFLYQLSYTFNNTGKVVQLDINFVTRNSPKPDEIKTDVRHGFLWDGSRLKMLSFVEMFLGRPFVALPEYNSDNKIGSESWFTGWKGVFTDRIPFTVKYTYQKDGGYEVKGLLEPDNSKDSILKYTKRYDPKGRITHRCIYNRELRKPVPNDPENAETFHYEYNLEGKIFRMTYQKGTAKPTIYEYDYKDPDDRGNYRIMQVRNEYRILLYEFGWKIKYSEE